MEKPPTVIARPASNSCCCRDGYCAGSFEMAELGVDKIRVSPKTIGSDGFG